MNTPGKKTLRPRQTAVGVLLVAPTLLLLLGYFIYPLISVLLRAFAGPEFGLPRFIGLWESRGFRNILINTFGIAGWTTIICLLIGYPLAFHLTRMSRRAAQIVLSIYMLSLFTSVLARLYAWTILLGDAGVLNSLLQTAHVIDSPISLLFNRSGVLVGMVHTLLPYAILILYSSMSRIDDTLLDASRSLGGSTLGTFLRVYLPLSMQGVYAAALLVFIIALGYFLTPAILGGAGNITISMFVRQKIAILDWNNAAAMSMVLLVVTLALFYVFDRVFGAERMIVGGTRR